MPRPAAKRGNHQRATVHHQRTRSCHAKPTSAMIGTQNMVQQRKAATVHLSRATVTPREAPTNGLRKDRASSRFRHHRSRIRNHPSLNAPRGPGNQQPAPFSAFSTSPRGTFSRGSRNAPHPACAGYNTSPTRNNSWTSILTDHPTIKAILGAGLRAEGQIGGRKPPFIPPELRSTQPSYPGFVHME